MWDTLKGKALETVEALRPALPSLPSLPSFPTLPVLPTLPTLSVFSSFPALLRPQVKEAMEDTPEAESDSPVIRVIQKMIRYIKRFLEIAFFPFLSFLMASFIANEMIIYPAPIRLAFFLFTFLLCLSSTFIVVLLCLFYLCKWGYHYYVNEMSGGPKRIIMPTLFAFLPLTTKTYSNRLINWLATPFQYGEKWSKKDGEELKQRMELYETALKESFPYVEALKNQDPFEEQLQKIAKVFEELHQPPPTPPEATLPPTIQPINPENTARFVAAPAGPLPPVIQPAPAPAQ
jgi:hypothetical protein